VAGIKTLVALADIASSLQSSGLIILEDDISLLLI